MFELKLPLYILVNNPTDGNVVDDHYWDNFLRFSDDPKMVPFFTTEQTANEHIDANELEQAVYIHKFGDEEPLVKFLIHIQSCRFSEIAIDPASPQVEFSVVSVQLLINTMLQFNSSIGRTKPSDN